MPLDVPGRVNGHGEGGEVELPDGSNVDEEEKSVGLRAYQRWKEELRVPIWHEDILTVQLITLCRKKILS